MVSKSFLIALLFVTSLNLANLAGQDSGWTRRTVPVSVVDDQWLPVQGLSAANFRGKLRGHKVEILSVSVDTRPRHIVLLLDASGSMMGEQWETAKSLAEDLIRFAPPSASIAQMGFSETVLETEGFDQDQSALLRHLADLVKVCEQPRKTRRTALFDAVESARGALGVFEFGDVIFAVTDGDDNMSRTKPKRVEQDLVRAGVRLFSALVPRVRLFSALLPGEGLGTRTQIPAYTEGVIRLLSMIEATGGDLLAFPYGAASEPYPYIKAKTKDEATRVAFHRLFEEVGEPYRLELKLPETLDKPTKWNLEVLDGKGKPNRQVEVHYPQQLMPCTKVGP
jgi:hypothetical protein